MGLWEHLFGQHHQHSDHERRLIEIIQRQEREAEKQSKRIAILEEHLWKCRHKEDGVKLDVVFTNN